MGREVRGESVGSIGWLVINWVKSAGQMSGWVWLGLVGSGKKLSLVGVSAVGWLG